MTLFRILAVFLLSIASTFGADLATDSIFAPSSFWYKPIPVNAPLHANSANYVAEFLRQKKLYFGAVGINVNDYSSPVYVVERDAPTVQVTQWNCQKKTWADDSLARQWAAVPIPQYALPAAGTDSSMTIYQPSTETIWEFWAARKVNGQWQACWGGRLQQASRSDGLWPFPYGTTATGLPFLGGQITAEELQRGEIKHAMGINLPDLEANGILSWPAKRGDGLNPTNLPNRIMEGQRFRLDPSVNVDALKLHPVGKIVAKAAQKYGFVVWDRSGAITLRAQDAKSYTLAGQPDPYPVLWAGSPNWAILTNGFPWDKLQFLPKDYGKPQ